MKITKNQLRQIIKEELGEAIGPGGADDIGEAAFELGKFFTGQLSEAAEVVAMALEQVGAARAAQKLRQGAQTGFADSSGEAGGHTFSSDKAGSQQAALDAWRQGQ